MKSKYCPICKKELQGSKMYYGYCSYCGSLLIGEFIPLQENYDDIGATYWNKILYTKVYKQGKCGLIKGYGKEIVPCYYRDAYIDSSNPNMAWVYASSHYGLYNIEKKLAIPCIYVKSYADNPSFSNGISCVFKNVENGNHYIFNDIGNPIREFIVRESEEIFCARYYKEPGLDIFLKIYNDEEYIFYSVLNKEGTEIAKFNCISKSYFPTSWYFYFTGSLYFVFVEDYRNYWGAMIFDRQGKLVWKVNRTEFCAPFNNIPSPEAFFVKDRYINAKGESILIGLFSGGLPFYNGVAFCRDKDSRKWGCIDKKGKILLPFEYNYFSEIDILENDIDFDATGLYLCKKGNYWGVININGKKIIPCCFKKICNNGRRDIIFVQYYKNDKWGFYNIQGKKLGNLDLDEIPYFHEKSRIVLAKKGNYCYVINENGREICRFLEKTYSSCYSENNSPSIITVSMDNLNLSGCINDKGEEIIPCYFEYIKVDPDETIIWARNNKNSPFLLMDNLGRIKFECSDYIKLSIEGIKHYFYAYKQGEKWGAINKKGEEILPCIYDSIRYGYYCFFVKLNNVWGIIKMNSRCFDKPINENEPIDIVFNIGE